MYENQHIIIDNKKHCCGCEACINACPVGCIKMVEDEDGFRFPSVDTSRCINCGKCKAVCFYNKPVETNKDNIKAYACYNKNDYERETSSSGGIFILLAKCIIEQGGVVYGVAYDRKEGAICDRAETIADCEKFKGSKYVQSINKGCFALVRKDILDGKIVLYTGTPCQINGLHAFLGGIDKSKLFCVDVICHGVPSALLYKEYVKWLECKYKDKIVDIKFRDKTYGWGNYALRITFSSGKSFVSQGWKDYFLYNFIQSKAMRESCFECRANNYANKSDITLADYWGWQRKFKNLSDGKGLSALIVRTSNGERLLNSIRKDVIIEPSSIDDIAISNQNLINQNLKMPKGRKKLLCKLKHYGLGKGLYLWQLKQKIRHNGGILLRKIKNK